MTRREAIKSIFVLGAVGSASYAGFRVFELHREVNELKFSSQISLIGDLADAIIPASDTPGAKAAGVETFIVSVLINCTTNVEQNLFLEGLEKVQTCANKTFGASFSLCTTQQRSSVLSQLEKSEVYDAKLLNKINNKFFGAPFFSKLKELTVQGYCNSLLGVTKGMAYDFIPAHFNACIPLKNNQKSWATK